LTITALAERICILAAKDRNLPLSYGKQTQVLPTRTPREVPTAGIKFTEKMSGYYSSTVTTDDYAAAYAQGLSSQSPITFVVTVECPDVNKLVSDSKHEGLIVGTVAAPEISSSPMAAKGKFNLFVQDLNDTDVCKMVYDMDCFDASTGQNYHFYGYKKVTNGNVLQMWPQTSTLYVTISKAYGEQSKVCGRGILHIKPLDFAKQMLTFSVSLLPWHAFAAMR
jgi:cholesterol oxidase